MMSCTDNHHIQAKAMSNEMNNQQSSASRKTGSSLRPPEQALKCPRCDSPNTKFCYYNNYSLTQPRHFCKSCRRYWTKGGALRNVPIGGGCRKNKKIRSSSGSRLSGDSRDSPASSENGGLNFFHAPSSMELQLLGSGGGISFARNGIFSNFVTYGDISSSATCVPTPSAVLNPTTNPSCFDIEGSSTTNTAGSLMGFNFTTGSSSASGFNSGRLSSVHHQDMGSSVNIQSNNNSLASSIESLSCLNQDLHWKLQQQRLGMLFGNEEINQCSKERDFGSNGGDNLLHGVHHDHHQIEKPQPILFQNLEIPKEEAACDPRKSSGFGGNNTTTEWFFENRSTTFPNSKNSSEQGIFQGNENTSTWNGIHQDWNHHHHHPQQQQQLHHQHQYSTALPE